MQLEIDNVSKSFGKKKVLDNLSFQVNPGEIIGLVGENGAGKSSLLRILATISRANTGSIRLGKWTYGKNRKQLRRLVGFVPQDIALWEDMTVEENMVFFEKLSWVNRSKNELKQLCEDMELLKWKEPVHTLSGGMKRKLNMAISFIHNPELLLLDEPTVGIDLRSKKEIAAYLKQKAQVDHKMIMYTSHDMDEIQSICDAVVCIGNDPFYENLLREANMKIISI
ncbi:ABC transporter ATP-binding protein [Oceanobacillus jeddahense]|uniref:ABC transporter ATP-binding protein n=1 Tax=Oceanobacillus jeddahense TaxID=1462527 RepID=UPI000595FFD9|nr:ABC transporter ATP-binding protein [Oceanobacillus jeddahense]